MPSVQPYRPVDVRIKDACAPGWTLACRDAAIDAGVSRTTWYDRIADGRWTPILGSVISIADPGIPIPWSAIAMAATMEAGTDAALHGSAALRQLGVWDERRHDGSVHVTAPRFVRAVSSLGVTFHRHGARSAPDIVLADHVPTSVFTDAWIQASVELSPLQLAYVLRQAIYQELVTVDAVEHRVLEAVGRRGIVHARTALDWFHAGSAGTKSASEDRIHPRLIAGLGCPPLVNVMGATGIPDFEPDFVWLLERIILEIDGRQHDTDPATRERDRRRDELLRSAGWIVIRVHYRRVWTDLGGVISEVRAAFANRT